jgi:hypothetical protein
MSVNVLEESLDTDEPFCKRRVTGEALKRLEISISGHS